MRVGGEGRGKKPPSPPLAFISPFPISFFPRHQSLMASRKHAGTPIEVASLSTSETAEAPRSYGRCAAYCPPPEHAP